ncbi:MAG: transcription termination/antitermination protein NusA, partial [Clostridia bacterium]|nr:transcription termination/antitermination protein NusA [Clostridia bacterium]
MNEEFYKALEALQQEKGIPPKYMLEKIRAAIASAVKRDRSVPAENVDVVFDEEKKTIEVFIKRLIVDEVQDPSIEASLEEAHAVSSHYQLGDYLREQVDPT